MTTTQPTVVEESDWRSKRTRRLLVTSASQHETFELCRRKWWLKQVRKLEEPERAATVFGDVLHAVIERFLSADAQGRSLTGEPVELYPEGWHKCIPRFAEKPVEGFISPEEQDIIKRLIAKAIESGVLERRLGGEVEIDFRHDVITLKCEACKGSGKVCDVCRAPSYERPPHGWTCDEGHGGEDATCPTCKGDGKGTHIQIMGFIDLLFEDEVQDHKSVKAMRWAKSPEALKQTTQMLIYAKVCLDKARAEGRRIDRVTLRHNIYCKDGNDLRVRKSETQVTVEEIERAWTKIQVNGVEMDRLRRTAEKWTDIPDPRSLQEACNAYGGCPYRSICSGKESELGYEQRLANSKKYGYNGQPINAMSINAMSNKAMSITVNGQTPAQSSPITKGSAMAPPLGLAGKLAAQRALNAATAGGAPAAKPAVNAPVLPTPSAPAPAQAPVQQAAPAPAPQQAQQAASNALTPPWFNPGCRACSGNASPGFNTKGNPCMICSSQAAANGRPHPNEFVIEPTGDGKFVWEHVGTGNAGASPTQHAATQVVAEAKQAPVSAPTPPPTPAAPAATGAPAGATGLAARLRKNAAAAAPAAPVAAAAPTPEPAAPGPAVPPQPAGVDPGDVKETKPGGRMGRPAKGFVLLINSICEKSEDIKDRRPIDLAEVFARYADSMVEEARKTNTEIVSYYDLDVFKRRDYMAKCAPLMAEGFGTAFVVVTGIGQGASDMKALVDALKPLAGTVVHGVLS